MEVLGCRIVTTKTECHCFGCARLFPAGCKIQKVKKLDAGKYISTSWCKVCITYYTRHMGSEDGIKYGELKSNDPVGWEKIKKEIEQE